MFFPQCNCYGDKSTDTDGSHPGFCVATWLLGTAATLGFVMLVTILILGICLCRVCKRVKKQKLLKVITDTPGEAELHYAELLNLPDSSRGQCDGGTCPAPPAIQNTEYATVAELKESNEDGYTQEDSYNQEEKEDSGLDNGQRVNELLLEQE